MIKPKKSLGQNFLIDKNIINIISEIVDIKNKSILEVGPGTGNLTSSLLKKNPRELIVVEKDRELVSLLRKEFGNNIKIINDDILNLQEDILCENQLLVFGNLPYNISTAILSKWILNLDDKKIWFKNLILMFQKEVADRILSSHNSSKYGRLSIIANWKLDVKKIIDIKPGCFSPRPKIDSSLLFFSHKKSPFKLKNPYSLEKITRIFFNHRRKKIKKPFYQIFTKNNKVLDKLNISLDLRPQNLDYETYLKLAREFENLSS